MRHRMKGKLLHAMTQPLIPLVKEYGRCYLSLTRKILGTIFQALGRICQILLYTIPPESTFTNAIVFEIKFKLMVITSYSVLMAIMEILNLYLEMWLSFRVPKSL
jgi:hypothetical protein